MLKKYYEAKNPLALAINFLPPPPPAILFSYVRFTKTEGTENRGYVWYVNRATFLTRLSQRAPLLIK